MALIKKHKEEVQAARLDEKLIEKIQPKGGITFKEPSYITCGDGYIRCIHIYALPNSLNDHWLSNLFAVNDSICTMAISTKDVAEVKKNINRSITEENARYVTAKHHSELYDAEKRLQELNQLYDEISRMGEVLKLCDFRIFVKDYTLSGLEEKCNEIVKNLEADSYMTTTLLNEQKNEWRSVFYPYKKVHQEPFTMKGLALTTEQLSLGYPFNYSELLDDQGVLLGFSQTGGAVLFDIFTKTFKRKHYNAIVSGDMGSGKSTLLKKLFKHNASIGNYIRTFDISGEFTNLTNEFGGKVIKCNGSEGMLNPLEILRSSDDDYTSFANHISKLKSFFNCIIPSIDDLLLQDLSNYLREFYSIYDLIPTDTSSITTRGAENYPTFSNFRMFLQRKLDEVNERDKGAETDVQTALNVASATNIDTLLKAVNNLINNYGNMFDGHTSINDISKEKIVTFDISAIKDLGEIFTAQMQNLVSLCWDNAVQNGTEMKRLWEDGNTASQDITKFLIIVDESHRWVNTSMPYILNMIIRYEREARKYFTGIILASQSVRDFVPEGKTADLDKIKILFELAQYKFMFKQDSATLEHISGVFGESLTYSQISQIPYLQQGDTILSISGDRSIRFKVYLSPDYEQQLFSGGR